MIILRDMVETDIEDYVRWFMEDLEWMNWDAPWEKNLSANAEEERKEWEACYRRVKDKPADAQRWKFEIERDGVHIGWVSAYDDLEYVENPEGIVAIGIDIPEVMHRRNGSGTEAMKQFMDYLAANGQKSLYTQTWSGNYPMLRLAEKLGFKEVYRKKDYREINGQKYDALLLRLDLE